MTTNDDLVDLSDEPKPASKPMTNAQQVELDRLSAQTGEPTPSEHLTEDEAAQKIKELHEEAMQEGTDDYRKVIDQDEP